MQLATSSARAASSSEFDYILAGGGLQAGLLVLAIRHYQPSASILVVERGERFGGNHTWSFHGKDIPKAAAAWVDEIPTVRWDSYRVSFPQYTAEVRQTYAATQSHWFADAVIRRLVENTGGRGLLRLNTEVDALGPTYLDTVDGQRFSAGCVIDCRGRAPQLSRAEQSDFNTLGNCGYQKFFGAEIELTGDWPFSTPTLMDACVDQTDGFHFVYVLPFTRRRILVEDTWFSDSRELDCQASSKHLREYINKFVDGVWNTTRLERGCLPMPLSGMAPPPAGGRGRSESPAGGYAGGWFHAATGYSFPLAVQFADAVARTRPELASIAIEGLRRQHQFRFRFSRLLNRLLFRLVRPDARWQVFQRLYRSVGSDVLSRFYAHQYSATDAFRMVVGVPPSRLTPFKFVRGFQVDRQAYGASHLESSI